MAPPSELTPAQGGIVHAEAVRPHHKVAWLIDAANRGAVDFVIDDDSDVPARLVRNAERGGDVAPILDKVFGSRDEIPLGQYDSKFAGAWGTLGKRLDEWREGSGLWEPWSRSDVAATGWIGGIGAVLGAGAAFLGGWLLAAWPGWIGLAVAGGLLAGYALAMALSGFERAVRTPEGSAAWLRVESFRRFLAESEVHHAEEAARRGVLREYAAWAVALGQIDHWSRVVSVSSVAPTEAGVHDVHMAPALGAATHRMSAAPSASSSGGGSSGGSFGGGSVGGGGGGGGGGSW